MTATLEPDLLEPVTEKTKALNVGNIPTQGMIGYEYDPKKQSLVIMYDKTAADGSHIANIPATPEEYATFGRHMETLRSNNSRVAGDEKRAAALRAKTLAQSQRN